MQKTYTDIRIEIGQAVNNTWALIAGEMGNGEQRSPEGYDKRFKELFPMVLKTSEWGRDYAAIAGTTQENQNASGKTST